MSEIYGSGKFLYQYVENWGNLPSGWNYQECPGVAVNSKDQVYVLTRSEHPVIVYDLAGNFIRSFGEGLFSKRTHGLYIGFDDSIWIADDGLHTIQKFSS